MLCYFELMGARMCQTTALPAIYRPSSYARCSAPKRVRCIVTSSSQGNLFLLNRSIPRPTSQSQPGGAAAVTLIWGSSFCLKVRITKIKPGKPLGGRHSRSECVWHWTCHWITGLAATSPRLCATQQDI